MLPCQGSDPGSTPGSRIYGFCSKKDKMGKSNYHIHTTISDGKLSPEELIKLAIKRKFDTICITDHYKLPSRFIESNDFYSEKDYNNLKELKIRYKDKIKILIGVEFDWLEDYKGWLKKEAQKRHYDYKFASIHFLKIGGEYSSLDLSEKTFQDMIKKSGGIEKLVTNYFSSLREAVKSGYFDVVAHLDIIKIWNDNKKYFSGEEDWYKGEIQKTLAAISKKKMKIELNTAGWRKPCNEQYPSNEILKEVKKVKIPLIIGTDAHKENELEAGLEETNILLKKKV